jgi:hypothetical protein
LEPVSKNKDQGFWPYARFNNPAETIQSLSQAIGRLLTTMINSSDVLSSFWAKVFPSIHFEKSKISRGNNIQMIALNQCSDELITQYEAIFSFDNDNSKKRIVELICMELNANKDSSQYMALNKYTISKETALTFSGQGKEFTHPDKFLGEKRVISTKEILNGMFDTSSSREQIGKIRDLRTTFGSKKTKVKPMVISPRSALGHKAKNFITKDLKDLRNNSLRIKMKEWFTAFSSERMQTASVKMLQAHFDELFTQELVYAESAIDSDDAISEMEDGD